MRIASAQGSDIRLAPIHADDGCAHLNQLRSKMTHSAAHIEYALSSQWQMHCLQVRHARPVDRERVGGIEDFEAPMPADPLVFVIPPANVDGVGQLLGWGWCWGP